MKYSIKEFTAKSCNRAGSQMNSNIYQMKYNNLKTTKERNAKERLFGSTHPIQKTSRPM